jgi:hypothetical protein
MLYYYVSLSRILPGDKRPRQWPPAARGSTDTAEAALAEAAFVAAVTDTRAGGSDEITPADASAGR